MAIQPPPTLQDTQPESLNVINLSSKSISTPCKLALSKGLSFVPTTQCNDFNTIIDFHKFFRTLRIREFFSPKPTLTEPENKNTATEIVTRAKQPFRAKSTFCPPKNNHSLETYCRLVEKDVTQILNKKREYKTMNNLPKEQREALMELKNDVNVIVKPADKGGAIVIQNRADYVKEITRQLGDESFYRKLSSCPITQFKKEIHGKLQSFLDDQEIDKNEFEFMKVDFPVTPVIYTLPKIHKRLDSPPGRPIVSSIGSLTEKISTFVDSSLKPHVTALPAYVRDSMDMINTLKTIGDLEGELIMATLDVESLYTCIPHTGGLEALTYYLNKRDTQLSPSTNCIRELAELVLTKNYFMFENDHYLQTRGTAMGSRMAPNYAGLYMGLFEEEAVLGPNNPFLTHIKLWRRYVDDIFLLWDGSEQDLQMFFDYVNSYNQFLRFTMTSDRREIHFLDISIMRNGKSFTTNVYRKPTDSNALLRADSFHPLPLKRSLPISQHSRIRRLCSDEMDYKVQADLLDTRFKSRGYPEDWLTKARERFRDHTQEDVLQSKRDASTNNNPLCILQYSALGKSFEHIIKQHWHILSSDPRMATSFKDMPRVVYKRPPNIRQTVVKSDLIPITPQPSFLNQIPDGNYRCAHCAQCNFTTKSHTFTHPLTGKRFDVKGIITCTTQNVVYLLKCPCGLGYVGKTTRALKTRISEHRSSIRNQDPKSPVAMHFMSAKHNVASLKYQGIEHVKCPRRGGDVNRLLLQRESFWIYTLNTMSPKGMNEDFSINHFL